MIPITLHDSIKPAGLVRRGVAKFVWIQFGGWAVRARLASPNGRRLRAGSLKLFHYITRWFHTEWPNADTSQLVLSIRCRTRRVRFEHKDQQIHAVDWSQGESDWSLEHGRLPNFGSNRSEKLNFSSFSESFLCNSETFKEKKFSRTSSANVKYQAKMSDTQK